jgi:hypothetical protein
MFGRLIYVAVDANTTVPAPAVEIMPRTLRVTFDVEKKIDPEPNRVKVSIYNLNRQSRAALEAPGPPQAITVRAGYADELGIGLNDTVKVASLPAVTIADITNVVHKHEGADWITTVEGGEGDFAYRCGVVNEEVAPGQIAAYVFGRLFYSFGAAWKGQTDRALLCANAMQVFANNTVLATSDRLNHGAMAVYQQAFYRSVSLSGFSRDILKRMCERHDLVWFFDNNVAVVAPVTGDIGNTPTEISAKTGLIAYPERMDHGGVRFRSLLRPDLAIWSKHNVIHTTDDKKDAFSGLYKFGRIVHKGDSHGGDFTTEVEGILCQ